MSWNWPVILVRDCTNYVKMNCRRWHPIRSARFDDLLKWMWAEKWNNLELQLVDPGWSPEITAWVTRHDLYCLKKGSFWGLKVKRDTPKCHLLEAQFMVKIFRRKGLPQSDDKNYFWNNYDFNFIYRFIYLINENHSMLSAA